MIMQLKDAVSKSEKGKKLKIAYTACSTRVDKAGFVQVLNMCNALSDIGADVKLFTMFTRQEMNAAGKARLSEFTALSNGRWELSVNPYPSGFAARRAPGPVFAAMRRMAHVKVVLKARLRRPDALYTREYSHVLLARPLRTPIVMEVHQTKAPLMPPDRLRALCSIARRKRAMLLCAISEALAEDLERAGAPASKVIVAHSAAPSAAGFADKRDARARLKIAAADKLAVYTGHLYQGKGVNDLIHAAARLPKVKFLIVGGESDAVAAAEDLARSLGASNLKLTGTVPPRQATLYQAAADVLVATLHDGEMFQSPLKIAEYAAARRPIVATDVAPLRARLTDNKEALFYKLSDSADLAAKIDALLKDSELADKLAAAAFKKIGGWTWEKRAVQIADAIVNKLL